LQYHTSAVSALRFNAASTLLATGSQDATVALWSLYPPRHLV
jgi:WD40 repeat protein